MKEVNYKDLKFNPFNLIGGEWMLVTAGNEQELKEDGFFYKETIEQSYPLRDYHTMYIGKIEKVLARDDEYLK